MRKEKGDKRRKTTCTLSITQDLVLIRNRQLPSTEEKLMNFVKKVTTGPLVISKY